MELSMKSLLLSAVVLLVLFSCEQPTVSFNHEPLLPEAEGRTWTYIRSSWNSADTVNYTIYKAEMINGEQWYSFDLGMHPASMFTNRDNGMWVRPRYDTSSDLLLIKYGAWTGDMYGAENIVLHSIEGEPIYCIHSVRVDAVNNMVTVPAGTFSSTVYTETLRGRDSRALYDQVTYWTVPGVGFVRIKNQYELYELMGTGSR